MNGVILRLIGAFGPLGPVRQAILFRARDVANADALRTTQKSAMGVVDVLPVVSGAANFAGVRSSSA